LVRFRFAAFRFAFGQRALMLKDAVVNISEKFRVVALAEAFGFVAPTARRVSAQGNTLGYHAHSNGPP
jgi:hypothetical protein